MAARKPKKKPPEKPPEVKRGPKPDHLVIEGDWEEVVKKVIRQPPKPRPGQ